MTARRKTTQVNRRKAIINLLNEACETLPDYPLCDIMYSALRKLKPEGQSISWIRDVGDDKLYSAIDNVITTEVEN